MGAIGAVSVQLRQLPELKKGGDGVHNEPNKYDIWNPSAGRSRSPFVSLGNAAYSYRAAHP